jgi:hypothetical protein
LFCASIILDGDGDCGGVQQVWQVHGICGSLVEKNQMTALMTGSASACRQDMLGCRQQLPQRVLCDLRCAGAMMLPRQDLQHGMVAQQVPPGDRGKSGGLFDMPHAACGVGLSWIVRS